MRKTGTVAALTMAALVGPFAANAEILKFTLTGGQFESGPATFEVDQRPTPSQSNSYGFGLNDVDIRYLGATSLYNLGFLNLGPTSYFNYAKSGDADTASGASSLFYGSPSSPVFNVGDFTYTDIGAGNQLNIDISPVPEPDAWVLMTMGTALVGLYLRRRRRGGPLSKQCMGRAESEREVGA